VTGVTNWVTYSSVCGTSFSFVVLHADTVVVFIELGMVGTVVTVTIFWSVTMVWLHTVSMTCTLPDRTIFSSPVFITDTGVVFHMSVLHTLFAIAC